MRYRNEHNSVEGEMDVFICHCDFKTCIKNVEILCVSDAFVCLFGFNQIWYDVFKEEDFVAGSKDLNKKFLRRSSRSIS